MLKQFFFAKSIIKNMLKMPHTSLTLWPVTKSFTGYRFKSYLSKQIPFLPHTKQFLDIQLVSLKEKYDYPTESLTHTQLKKGQKLMGLSGNVGLVYGGVPLYEKGTLLSNNEYESVKATVEKLGCRWIEYTINKDIDCVVHTTNLGEKRWFVSDDFLDEEELKPASTLRF